MNNLNLKKCTVRFLLGIGLATASITASAAVIETEFNDTFDFANYAAPGSNTGVIGDLSAASNDVDIWRFDLTAGAGFGATINNGSGVDFNEFNPLIVLFKEDAGFYRPVATNNPSSFVYNFGFTAWESGTYFLTVSAFQNSPVDAFGNIQSQTGFLSTEFITGTTFGGFQGQSFTSFDYDLSLTGAVTETVVPVPAAVWLFASGLLGLVGVARNSRRVA